jgi:hypothetical protein
VKSSETRGQNANCARSRSEGGDAEHRRTEEEPQDALLHVLPSTEVSLSCPSAQIWILLLHFSLRLRCDRKLPACSNCLSRPEVDCCEYSTAQGGTKAPAIHTEPGDIAASESIDDEAPPGNKHDRQPGSLQSKLERLEGIIQKFMGESQTVRSDEGYQSALSGLAAEVDNGRRRGTVNNESEVESSHSPQFMSRAGETLWATLLSEVCS